MKWPKARKHVPYYYSWRDIGFVMLVIAIIAIGWALLLLAFLSLPAPHLATAGDIVNFRVARRLASVTLSNDKVTARASEPIKTLSMEISAYSPTVQETDGDPMTTASGKRVYVGGIAADLSVLPFGSRIIIPGYNGGEPCTVIDTGFAIRGNILDVFFWHESEAIHWGRRKNVRVEVLYVPGRKQ